MAFARACYLHSTTALPSNPFSTPTGIYTNYGCECNGDVTTTTLRDEANSTAFIDLSMLRHSSAAYVRADHRELCLGHSHANLMPARLAHLQALAIPAKEASWDLL